MVNAERLEKGLYWQRAWKLVEGCTKVSPGCANCWSETESSMRRFHPNHKIFERAQWVTDLEGKFDGHILCREDNLNLPLQVKKPTVFSIWNDLYHEDVPDDFRDRAYAVMALCPQHTFLVLTKRAERMAEYLREAELEIRDEIKYSAMAESVQWPLPNVWHGVTAENQQTSNDRIPHLLNVPGKRFLSIEPMLGAIDLDSIYVGTDHARWVDCVLLGGESGPDARPMHFSWAYSIKDQCAAAGVHFFFKQWGEWITGAQTQMEKEKGAKMYRPGTYHDWGNGSVSLRVGKKSAGRTLDGVTYNSLPWGYCGK